MQVSGDRPTTRTVKNLYSRLPPPIPREVVCFDGSGSSWAPAWRFSWPGVPDCLPCRVRLPLDLILNDSQTWNRQALPFASQRLVAQVVPGSSAFPATEGAWASPTSSFTARQRLCTCKGVIFRIVLHWLFNFSPTLVCVRPCGLLTNSVTLRQREMDNLRTSGSNSLCSIGSDFTEKTAKRRKLCSHTFLAPLHLQLLLPLL